MANLTLRLVKGSPLTNAEVDGNFSNVNSEITALTSNVGIIGDLTTTNKSNLVAAINEIASESTSNVSITGGNISGVLSISAVNTVRANTITANVAVTGPNIYSTVNVTGTYFLGNGSLLTGISVDSTRIISGNSTFYVTAANSSIFGNVSGSTVITIGKDGASTANIQVLGNLTSTVVKTSDLQDSSGRTLRILDESNVVIWGE
jgi:hypothetical protein